jgi:alpha-tubulin suppressor-like RCC1 family protein
MTFLVVAWGANTMGQLGHGTTQDEPLPIPVLLQPNDAIGPMGLFPLRQIIGGPNSTYCIDARGHVYTCGNNKLQWMSMASVSNIAFLAAGWSHVLALDHHGHVWSWGSNEKGQLGHDHLETKDPKQLQLQEVVQIACGVWHSAALCTNNRVYLWGCNKKGKCNAPMKEKMVSTPRLLSLPHSKAQVTAVKCGLNATYIQFQTNSIIIIGNQGSKSVQSETSLPMQVISIADPAVDGTVQHIESTWRSLVVTTERNQMGILGPVGSVKNSNGEQIQWIRNLSLWDQFCVGSEHLMTLVKPNQVLAWGWNEHGNCGVSCPKLSTWFPSNGFHGIRGSIPVEELHLDDVLVPTPVDFSWALRNVPKNATVNVDMIGGGFSHSFAVFQIFSDEEWSLSSV